MRSNREFVIYNKKELQEFTNAARIEKVEDGLIRFINSKLAKSFNAGLDEAIVEFHTALLVKDGFIDKSFSQEIFYLDLDRVIKQTLKKIISEKNVAEIIKSADIPEKYGKSPKIVFSWKQE